MSKLQEPCGIAFQFLSKLRINKEPALNLMHKEEKKIKKRNANKSYM